MKNVLMYPFGREAEVIVRNCDLLKDLELICLVKPDRYDDGEKTYDVNDRKIPIVCDFEKGLETYEPDVVWFTAYEGQLEFEKEYLPFIKLVIESNKQMILDEDIINLADKHVEDISGYLYDRKKMEKIKPECGDYLHPINTPVVYICSLYGDLCKFDLQLMMRRELLKRNISMVQMGTRKNCARFGFFDIPWFMESDGITDKEKTLMFNQYLKDLEEKEKPELIVVGVPGEVCIATNKYVGGFGYLARDYFVAIHPDMVVMLLPYGIYQETELRSISSTITQRLGAPIDIFCRTNKHLLVDEMETEQKWTYLTVNENDRKENATLENLYELDLKNMPQMVDMMIDKLKEYGMVDSV